MHYNINCIERRHYEFTKIPFGLKRTPITFQIVIVEFLRGIDGVVYQVYRDNLLVFNKTDEQHVEH